ncbi:MAG: hypothetical protein KDA86_20385 [Planctomycetaceae bacterium]|nr:hypothetical protein [Planctomycetaceae bacterium]
MFTSRSFLGQILLSWSCLCICTGGNLLGQDNPTAAPKPVYGPPENIIYIPFEDFEDVFENEDASVVLPYSEYLELWALKAAADGAAKKPVEAVITSASYVATIEEDIARIRAELTINVVGQPWVEVPLEFGDAAVGSVDNGDGDVLLRGTGDGTYSLLFKKQGEQTVSLELTARVVTSPDGRQIDFDVPPSAITNFELSVPADDQEVEVRPRLVQLAVEDGENETRVRASLGATKHIAAAWRPRATAQPEMQLLTSVNNRQAFRIADGLIHTDAWLTFDVLRGKLQQVKVSVPPTCRVLDVSASTKVQGWQTEESDDQQELTIDLLSAVDDEVTVEIHTEQKLDGQTVELGGRSADGALHGVHALDVVRESGQIAISHGEDLTLRITEQAGVVRIEPNEVAKEIRQPGVLAFKYYNPELTLTAAVAEVEPRVTVTQNTSLTIGDDELDLLTELSYTIERAGLFELRIELPDGVIIDDVRSAQLKEYRAEDNLLMVLLRERTLGSVEITVEGHVELDEETPELTLPVPEPLNVDRETGTVRLFADDSVEVATDEESLESARPAPAPPHLTRGGARLRAAWQYTNRPVVIPITMTRKPTRLSSSVATSIDVQPTRTRVTTLVDFNVEYAGQDTFRFTVPEEAVETLQIEAVALSPTSPTLKQQTPGDAADGWVPYTLVMQRDVLGQQRFRVTYDLEPGAVMIPMAVEDEIEVAPADADEVGKTNPEREPAVDEHSDSPAEKDVTDSAESPPANDGPEAEADATESEGSDDETRDTGDVDGATTASETEATVDVEEAVELEVDPHRQGLTVRIIRPLGLEADDTREATALTRVTGEVQIEKEQSLTITADASGADVEPIDVRELTTLPKSGAMAFRYRKHPEDETIEVDITQARYDVQEVIATVVSRRLVEVVLSENVSATFRCRYKLKSTERQRLRVELPEAIEVLSVLVDDTEVRLEPDPANATGDFWDTYYVKVAREGESDEPFQLAFQFLGKVNPAPFEGGFQGKVVLPLPRIGDSATAAVQQTRVVVWVPRGYALVGDPVGFTQLGTARPLRALFSGSLWSPPGEDLDQWIGDVGNLTMEFPTTGRTAYHYSHLGDVREMTVVWWNTLSYTLLVSAALAVIAFVLMPTSWENKLGILLLILFGGLLLGLKSEQVAIQAFATARIGLLLMLVLWCVRGVLGLGRRMSPESPVAEPEKNEKPATVTPAVVPPANVSDHPESD